MAPIRMQAIFSFAAAILVFLPAIAYSTDYIVGDQEGWTIGFDYSEWAKDKKFHVGDTLTFIYTVGNHDVIKVDEKGFANCATSPNSGILTSGQDEITLTTPGNKWYICGVTGHCDSGQKLKITVLPKSMQWGAFSPAPEPAEPDFSWAPAPVATPGMWAFFSVAAAILVILPAIAYATDYVVGDNDGWTTGFNYSVWAADKKFRVGDALIFIYSEGSHNVAKVDGKGFAGCAVPPNATVLASGHDIITLTTTGNKWYICGVSGHCDAGQKLKITVLPKSMIGVAPSPAPDPEVVVPGISWAPPWLPWAPAPEMKRVGPLNLIIKLEQLTRFSGLEINLYSTILWEVTMSSK
ncbi:blue copper-like protein [Cinnamomum micranthum f. kanehirae]|uniref:Blue copper-like protein n=1 Tax=Cinnamomum micranthum f. kanehirae TaxID=337451 RepID=A0A3S3P3K2_9MAGN|nr:blue copper-like protein [Cinnamomum micranthum f. kanehirae]